MNYDLFKNDIDALLGAISSIPNISTIDAQLTALDDLFNDETDPGKKDALFAMKTSLAKVKEIHSRLDSLKNSPEKFFEEAKKLLTTHQALTKQGVGKPILTFDDDAIKYNIADGFISSTIPGSTISNVTKILEQMNRVSLMYLCIHDKVAAAKHKEDVANFQAKTDQTYREIGKALEPYKDTDVDKLGKDLADAKVNQLKQETDFSLYTEPGAKEKFMQGFDRCMEEKKYHENVVKDLEQEKTTLENFASTLDGSSLIEEAKAIQKQIVDGLDIKNQVFSENKMMANATLKSELNDLKKDYEKKGLELKQLKEAAGADSAPQLDRLEKLFEQSIRRINFTDIVKQLNDLIPKEVKDAHKEGLTIGFLKHHIADETSIPEQNLVLISFLLTRLDGTVPDELNNIPGGYLNFPLRSDAEAYLASLTPESLTEEGRKDQELLSYIAQLGSVESNLAAVRTTKGMTPEEIKSTEQMWSDILQELKKSPLYVHGMYEYMNLYQEKIKLASMINQKAYQADVQAAYATMQKTQEKALKEQLLEKKREIYDHCKTEIEKLPEDMQMRLLDTLGFFDEHQAKTLDEFENLYTAVKGTAAEMAGTKEKLIEEQKELAKKSDLEAYQYSDELWNKKFENQKMLADTAKATVDEYERKKNAIREITNSGAQKCRDLSDLSYVLDIQVKGNVCGGVNYFDSLAQHAVRLKKASKYTKEEGHRDSSEYEGIISGLNRITLMTSRKRENSKIDKDNPVMEPSFNKYDDKKSMKQNTQDELNSLKKKAEGYIKAKKAQWFHWIPSTMRKYRLSYAQNVVDFCEAQLSILEHTTFEDLDIAADSKAYYSRKKVLQKAGEMKIHGVIFSNDLWKERQQFIDYSHTPPLSNVQAGGNGDQLAVNQPMMQNNIMNEQEEISTSINTDKKKQLQTN